MIVHVGTSNPVKLRAAKNSVLRWFGPAKVKAVKVASGVAAQPVSLGEIVRGARNRAERARMGADLGVGIESGMFRLAGASFNVTVAAVTDGRKTTLGGGPFLQVPPVAVRIVVKGEEELGAALAKSLGIRNPARGGGAVGLLSRGAVTRGRATELAVIMALAGR